MKLNNFTLIVLLLIVNLAISGCVDTEQYLHISREESPEENLDVLNLTTWDFSLYPTLHKGLEDLLANKSIEWVSYPISGDEAGLIVENIVKVNPDVFYKKIYAWVGIATP